MYIIYILYMYACTHMYIRMYEIRCNKGQGTESRREGERGRDKAHINTINRTLMIHHFIIVKRNFSADHPNADILIMYIDVP